MPALRLCCTARCANSAAPRSSCTLLAFKAVEIHTFCCSERVTSLRISKERPGTCGSLQYRDIPFLR